MEQHAVEGFALHESFVGHHVDSFDRFVQRDAKHIVREYGVITTRTRHNGQIGSATPAGAAAAAARSDPAAAREHVVVWTNPTWEPPSFEEANGVRRWLTPEEARIRRLTYESRLLVDVEHSVYAYDFSTKTRGALQGRERVRQQCVAIVPVMVGSSLCASRTTHAGREQQCPLDNGGGYFLINGSEKVVLPQRRRDTNRVEVLRERLGNRPFLCATVRSQDARKHRSTADFRVVLVPQATASHPHAMFAVHTHIKFLPSKLTRLRDLFALFGVTRRTQCERLVLAPKDFRTDPTLVFHVRRLLRGDDDDDGDSDDGDGIDGAEARYEQHTLPRLAASLFGLQQNTRAPTPSPPANKAQQDLHFAVRRLRSLLRTETLPHVGTDDDFRTTLWRKAVLVGRIVRRLLRVHLGREACNSKDDWRIKRLDTVGVKMAGMFRTLLRRTARSLQASVRKMTEQGRFVSIVDCVNARIVTGRLRKALATGKWSLADGAVEQDGVSQLLARDNTVQTLDHLRRINTPLHREAKNPVPRQLDPAQFGIVCQTETPEGAACGLSQNLALFALVRQRGAFADELAQWAFHTHAEPLVRPRSRRAAAADSVWDRPLVWVDGAPLAQALVPPQRLLAHLRRLRRAGDVPFDATVVWRRDCDSTYVPPEKKEEEEEEEPCGVHVWLDDGGLVRPVWRAEGAAAAAAARAVAGTAATLAYGALYRDARRRGWLEFMTKEEELCDLQGLRVASCVDDLVPGCTHAELARFAGLGTTAVLVTFLTHGPSTRGTYSCVMIKPAIGRSTLKQHARYPTSAHTLDYPQPRLVTSAPAAALNVGTENVASFGQNLVVAICSASFNQEDSIIFNRRSVDHGVGAVTSVRTHSAEESPTGTDEERFAIPCARVTKHVRRADFSGLDPTTAVARPGTSFPPRARAVLVGREIRTGTLGHRTKKHQVLRDHSLVHNVREHPTTVQSVVHTQNHRAHKAVRVRTQIARRAEIGDKFSTYSQKGTVGAVWAPEDMPFFADDGSQPDVLLNPHCMPSRMTVGTLLEAIFGTAACFRGKRGDATPFKYAGKGQALVRDLGRFLQEHCGLASDGTRAMCSGVTGEMMHTTVFSGVVHYKRQRHFARDKVYARGQVGPTVALTRQPVEKRRLQGGLRFGEMERDGALAAGASFVVQDRLCISSDAVDVVVCDRCGMLVDLVDDDNDNSSGVPHRMDKTARAPSAAPQRCGCGASSSASSSSQQQQQQQQSHSVVTMPYATKLLAQELQGLQWNMRVFTTPEHNNTRL